MSRSLCRWAALCGAGVLCYALLSFTDALTAWVEFVPIVQLRCGASCAERNAAATAPVASRATPVPVAKGPAGAAETHRKPDKAHAAQPPASPGKGGTRKPEKAPRAPPHKPPPRVASPPPSVGKLPPTVGGVVAADVRAKAEQAPVALPGKGALPEKPAVASAGEPLAGTGAKAAPHAGCTFATSLSPWWTHGRWEKSGEGPAYNRSACHGLALPLEDILEAPGPTWAWRPLPPKGAEGKGCRPGVLELGRWQVPLPGEWQELLRGRTIVFVGDSIARQQYFSLISLLLCQRRPTYLQHETYLVNITSLGSIVAYMASSNFVVEFATIPHRHADSWYVDAAGKKVKIKKQPTARLVDVANMTMPADFYRWKETPNVTFVINFGHWISSSRSDVFFTWDRAREKLLHDITTRHKAAEQIARHASSWFQANLKNGSIAVWQGYSPEMREGVVCSGRPHAWTGSMLKGLRRALEVGLPARRNFLVDVGCAITSAPKKGFWRKDGSHFTMPGIPDLENMFVLKLMLALGLSRSGGEGSSRTGQNPFFE